MLNRELNKSVSGVNSSIQYNVVNSTDFLVGVLTRPKYHCEPCVTRDRIQITHAHIPIHFVCKENTWRKENIDLNKR